MQEELLLMHNIPVTHQKGATVGTPGKGATNTMNPTTRKVNQADINNLGLNKLTYDPTTGKAQLGKLTNTAH